MSQISTIRSALRSINKPQQGLFAISCAERTAIVFRQLAAPTSVAVYDSIIDAAWNAVNMGTPISADFRELLSSLPEDKINDSCRPEYHATFAMGVLEHALDSLATPNSQEAVDLACCQSLDLHSSFDAIVLGSPNMIVNPASPPPSGPLESAELAEQTEILRIFTKMREIDPHICDRLRGRAKSASRILDSAITMLLKTRNSSV
jgi:hypothetical protein